MKLSILFLPLFIMYNVVAQVPRQVILEHFTNTYCSICGNNNPDLHDNMENNPNVLRITYHPSSPYSSCTLNQHNVSGNDDRTNQYGIYGATPRIVIQGEVKQPSSGLFSSSNLFDDYTGEMSPVSFEITSDTSDIDSISVTITLTVEDDLDVIHQYPILYLGLAEDTLFFNAPNGEGLHHNVFRKELYGTTGTGITLNNVVGYQTSFEFTVLRHLDWDMSRIFAFATLHDSSTDEILQSGASNFTPDFSADIKEQMENSFKYFNSNNILNIEFQQENLFDNVVVFDVQGKVLISKQTNQSSIQLDLQSLVPSMYIVQLINSNIPASTSFKVIR